MCAVINVQALKSPRKAGFGGGSEGGERLRLAGDLRSGAHFIAGQLSATAPVAGAAVAGGLATGNPFTAGTIAMGLPAAGDIAARQQEDAQASQESPGTRATKALAGGLAVGGVQSIGPGMFAGKVLGKGAAAAGPGLGSIIAKNMAEGIYPM